MKLLTHNHTCYMTSSFHLKLLYSRDQRFSSSRGLKSKHCLLNGRATPLAGPAHHFQSVPSVCATSSQGLDVRQQQLCRVTSVTISVLTHYFVVWLHLGFSSFVQRVTASWSVIYFIKAEKCPAGVSSGPWPRGSSWTCELVTCPKACKMLCKNMACELLPCTATTFHC